MFTIASCISKREQHNSPSKLFQKIFGRYNKEQEIDCSQSNDKNNARNYLSSSFQERAFCGTLYLRWHSRHSLVIDNLPAYQSDLTISSQLPSQSLKEKTNCPSQLQLNLFDQEQKHEVHLKISCSLVNQSLNQTKTHFNYQSSMHYQRLAICSPISNTKTGSHNYSAMFQIVLQA